jgi:hypothetical protein
MGWLLWASKVTALNDSCVVTIVGYRGNSVYRVVG